MLMPDSGASNVMKFAIRAPANSGVCRLNSGELETHRTVDIISIERAGNYHGKFHVLGGRISPINGVEPEDLRIGELEQRLTQEPIREIILALTRVLRHLGVSPLPPSSVAEWMRMVDMPSKK